MSAAEPERVADVVDLFTRAPLTHVNARAEAVADGRLIDVTRMANSIGYRTPVAVTRAAYALLTHGAKDPAARSARAHQMLQMGMFAVASLGASRRPRSTPFECYPGGLRCTLVAHVGPGDTVEPVVTMMLPEEETHA